MQVLGSFPGTPVSPWLNLISFHNPQSTSELCYSVEILIIVLVSKILFSNYTLGPRHFLKKKILQLPLNFSLAVSKIYEYVLTSIDLLLFLSIV